MKTLREYIDILNENQGPIDEITGAKGKKFTSQFDKGVGIIGGSLVGALGFGIVGLGTFSFTRAYYGAAIGAVLGALLGLRKNSIYKSIMAHSYEVFKNNDAISNSGIRGEEAIRIFINAIGRDISPENVYSIYDHTENKVAFMLRVIDWHEQPPPDPEGTDEGIIQKAVDTAKSSVPGLAAAIAAIKKVPVPKQPEKKLEEASPDSIRRIQELVKYK